MSTLTPDAARAAVLTAIDRVAPDADTGSLAGDADLLDELLLDSMDLLNIVVAVHEITGIEIPERDYGRLGTLDDFTTYLTDHAGS
jgi:acyl carrier protein